MKIAGDISIKSFFTYVEDFVEQIVDFQRQNLFHYGELVRLLNKQFLVIKSLVKAWPIKSDY